MLEKGGLEKLRERGAEYGTYQAITRLEEEISESRIPDYVGVRPSVSTARVLDIIANAVCDLLDWRDKIQSSNEGES